MPKTPQAFLNDIPLLARRRLALPLTAIVLAIGLAACSSTPESGSEVGGEAGGEHVGSGEQGEDGEGGESGEGGEESGAQYGLGETYDMVRAGARLVLRYNRATQTFEGRVTNTTRATLTRVRVEVHLSNGTELGPTPPIDLAPGQSVPVRLSARGETFATWGAHPEVGARAAAGLSSPMETPAAQLARAPAIVSRADSLVVSTVHAETSSPALPTLRVESRCAGTSCTLTHRASGYSDTLHLSDLESVPGSSRAVGSKHDITVMRSSGRFDGTDFTSFGAWMNHSAFAVLTEALTLQGIDIDVRYGVAGGDLTGSRPSGHAIWQGLMVGTPATGAGRGEALQGDAILSFDLSTSSLDAAFTSIRNIDRNTAHPTSEVRFNNVPVASGGTFQAGQVGNRIQGGIYGPGHTETAGVFEQSNIAGAFGAKRQ